MRGEPRHRWYVAATVLLAGLLAGVPAVASELAGDPSAVPPPGLELPEPDAAEEVAAPLETQELRRAAVRRALAPMLRDPDLGPRVHAAVADLDGDMVWRKGSGGATPASVTKVLTGVAALATLNPEERFSTWVADTGTNWMVLVGGGDPLLAREPGEVDAVDAAGTPVEEFGAPYPVRADILTLAARTAAELKAQGRTRVRLAYDDSLFTGPAENPAWRPDYVPEGVVAPIGPLWVDKGRPEQGYGRVDDPAGEAARAFADALREEGIRVRGRIAHNTAALDGDVLAEVESPPVREIVEWFVAWSDNEATEVIARHIGLARSGDGSFAGAVRGIEEALAELGVRTEGLSLYGGSGLSRDNVIAPATLIDALRVAADPDHPELSTVIGSLPVAGFTGSLTSRFDAADPASPGRVRAKTGTLTGVHSLAGTVVTADGTPMLFVLMADRVPAGRDGFARIALDNAAGALAACRCAAPAAG